MPVQMQFRLKYFSVGFYLIITEKHKHPGVFGFVSSCEHFYSDRPKIFICLVTNATCPYGIKTSLHLCHIR